MSAFRRTGIGSDSEDCLDEDGPTFPQEEIRVTDKRGQHKQSDYHERVAESLGKIQSDEIEKTLEELITECFMNPGPGRVIVKPDVFKYRGKMVIPDESKRTGTTGVILKVGYHCGSQFFDEKLQQFRELRPGDKVAYGTWTGTLFRFDQRPAYRVLADDEISTILNPNATKLLDVEA